MTIEDERARVWAAIDFNGERITELRESMRDVIKEAVQEAMPTALLSDDERRWVQLAIKKEAQSIAFRQSVINKTLLGLIWALIAGAGYIVKGWLESKGFKL